MTKELERTPRWVLILPAMITLVSVVVSVVWIWTIRAELPEPLARHWGANGRADGFSPLWQHLVFSAVFPVLMAAFMLALGAGVRQERSMAAVTSGLSVFLCVLMAGTVIAQRGLADARDASADVWILFAVGAGAAVGVVVALLVRRRSVPKAVRPVRLSPTAPRKDVPVGTHAAWLGRTRVGKGAWISLVGSTALLMALGVLSIVSGSVFGGITMLFIAVGIAVLGSSCWARVTVDRRGVRVRSLGFITWTRIELESIEGAGVKAVDPLGDFGGYGIRGGFDGSMGVITSAGPALRIERAGENPFWVTVDDAEQAAATVNGLLTRAN